VIQGVAGGGFIAQSKQISGYGFHRVVYLESPSEHGWAARSRLIFEDRIKQYEM